MASQATLIADPRIDRALDELRGLIQTRFPRARFQVHQGVGDDPDGVYLDAIMDTNDTDEAMDLIVERLLEIELGDGLPISVLPLRASER